MLTAISTGYYMWEIFSVSDLDVYVKFGYLVNMTQVRRA
jgi:hypothetical protein